MTSNLKAKKLFPITLLIAAILLLSSTFGALLAGASASSGIKNNGTDGININIYGTYYKTLAKQTSCAYARGGCAWYASARASELVGRNLGLHSPDNWWSTYAASNGFKKSSSPVAKGFAVFSNHIVVVENVCGTTLTVSEGSNPSASDADHGYCVIRKVERSTFEKSNYKGQSFRGYIDLGVRMNNPPIAETVPAGVSGVYVAKGSVDQAWHSYRGNTPDFTYTGVAKGVYGWWRIVNGNVDWSANGVYKNENGWWKCSNGKVDFSFSGLASNENGTWYLNGGKVDFSYTGEFFWNGEIWTVTNGRATLK